MLQQLITDRIKVDLNIGRSIPSRPQGGLVSRPGRNGPIDDQHGASGRAADRPHRPSHPLQSKGYILHERGADAAVSVREEVGRETSRGGIKYDETVVRVVGAAAVGVVIVIGGGDIPIDASQGHKRVVSIRNGHEAHPIHGISEGCGCRLAIAIATGRGKLGLALDPMLDQTLQPSYEGVEGGCPPSPGEVVHRPAPDGGMGRHAERKLRLAHGGRAVDFGHVSQSDPPALGMWCYFAGPATTRTTAKEPSLVFDATTTTTAFQCCTLRRQNQRMVNPIGRPIVGQVGMRCQQPIQCRAAGPHRIAAACTIRMGVGDGGVDAHVQRRDGAHDGRRGTTAVEQTRGGGAVATGTSIDLVFTAVFTAVFRPWSLPAAPRRRSISTTRGRGPPNGQADPAGDGGGVPPHPTLARDGVGHGGANVQGLGERDAEVGGQRLGIAREEGLAGPDGGAAAPTGGGGIGRGAPRRRVREEPLLEGGVEAEATEGGHGRARARKNAKNK